jgi:hypothetical protein
LENCRRATKPDARLVVIEAFFAEPGKPIPVNMIDTQVPLFDLHLMLAVNGKERSLAQYSTLLGKVGLRTIKTTPLDNGYVVIETVAGLSGREMQGIDYIRRPSRFRYYIDINTIDSDIRERRKTNHFLLSLSSSNRNQK